MPDYFTLEEVQDTPDVDFDFEDERIEAVAAAVVSIIEREVGTSFIARTVEDEIARWWRQRHHSAFPVRAVRDLGHGGRRRRH